MSNIVQSKSGTRVVLGYLIAMLLVVAIGILATVRLNQISAAVNDLTNNLAADMALSKEIANQILLVRLSANKYVRTQSQTDLDRFHKEFDGLKVLLDQASQQITDPERRERLDRIVPAIEGYGDAFNKVAELIRERQRTQSEVLDVQEFLIENKLIALRVHVISLNDPLAFLALGNAQDAFQWMRLNTAKYLEEGDERYSVMFEASYQQARTAFSSLETISQDPVQRRNSTEAKDAADAYHTGFQTIHAGYIEIKNLFETKLDVLEPEISNTALEVVTSIEREFQVQNERSQALILQTRFVLLATTTIAILAGSGLGIVFNRRIVERVRAEEKLRRYRDHLEELVEERTRDLEKAHAELVRRERLSALGQLTATVAHEIRNPLGTVRTAVFAVGDAIERDEMVRVERARQLAERNIIRCDRIITELLDYTRERVLNLEPTWVDEWLEGLLNEQTFPQDIVCVRRLTAGVQVAMDREHLRRAVINVVENAVDALQEEGAVETRLIVSTRVATDQLEIQVSDTGRGIPSDVMERVFEPLFSTKAVGVGLGLSIVKSIIQQHGGDIEIESGLDGGTTVTMWLPISR